MMGCFPGRSGTRYWSTVILELLPTCARAPTYGRECNPKQGLSVPVLERRRIRAGRGSGSVSKVDLHLTSGLVRPH